MTKVALLQYNTNLYSQKNDAKKNKKASQATVINFSDKTKTSKTVTNKPISKNKNVTKKTAPKKQGFWGGVWKDIKDWWNDKDKVSTDGHDDGKLSVKTALSSIGKSFFGGIIKDAVKHPVATAIAVGIGSVLTVATGGAILAPLVWGGFALGVAQVGAGAYLWHKSKNDGDAKRACETIGNGLFAAVTSAMSAKSALKAVSEAGVTGLDNIDDMNTLEALGKCIKVSPKAMRVGIKNVPNFFGSFNFSNIFNGATSKPTLNPKAAILNGFGEKTRFGMYTRKVPKFKASSFISKPKYKPSLTVKIAKDVPLIQLASSKKSSKK